MFLSLNLNQVILLILAVLPLSSLGAIFIYKLVFGYKHKYGQAKAICSKIVGNICSQSQKIEELTIGDLTIKNKDNKFICDEKEIQEKAFQNNLNLLFIAAAVSNINLKKYRFINDFLNRLNIQNGEKIKDKYNILEEIKHPLNEEMYTLVVENKKSKEIFAFSIGNSHDILQISNRFQNNFNRNEIAKNEKTKLEKIFKKVASNGLNTTTVAYRRLSKKKRKSYDYNFIAKDLIILGTFTSTHPISLEAKNILAKIEKEKKKIYLFSEETPEFIRGQYKKLNLKSKLVIFEGKDDLSLKKIGTKMKEKNTNIAFSHLSDSNYIKVVHTLINLENKTVFLKEKEDFKKLSHSVNLAKKLKEVVANFLPVKLAIITGIFLTLLTETAPILTIGQLIISELIINLGLILFISSKESDKKNIRALKMLNTKFSIFGLLTAILMWNLISQGWQLNHNSELYLNSYQTFNFLFLNICQLTIAASLIKNKNHEFFGKKLLFIVAILSVYTFSSSQNYFGLNAISAEEFLALITAILFITFTIYFNIHKLAPKISDLSINQSESY
jgi:hypothetical protein